MGMTAIAKQSRRIIPYNMSFEKALIAGLTGRLRHKEYLAWLRTLPCDGCGAPPPSQASHLNSRKGMGTKSPDALSIPECPVCHEQYERAGKPDAERRMARAAMYLLQAIWEGRFVWKR